MLKRALMSVLLAVVCAGANAGIYSLTDTDPGPDASFSKTVPVGGGSFSDTLNFTLPGPTSWEAAGSASSSYYGLNYFGFLIGQGITSMTVSIFGDTYSGVLGGVGFPTGTLVVNVPDQIVAAGSYSAVISGVAQDLKLIPGTPSYTFSLMATPVPEPESYAMFLAGLGLMGFIARRRRNV